MTFDPAKARNVPLIGGAQPLQVMVASLCTNCFPAVKPAVVIWKGYSLCLECFVPRRKAVDLNKIDNRTEVVPRHYKTTWGEDEPIDG